jgi:pimeloyl-ACP methyl ester carboxylesterase
MTAPPRRPLLVLLPGNPGEPFFYRDLAAELRERGHEVVLSAHPAPAASGLLPFAEHHAATTTAYLAASGRGVADVEVILIGHSVGAYLAHLIVAHRLLPVARLFLLFPFLMRPALSGRLILAALGIAPLVRAFLGGFRLLPRRIQLWLAARAGAGEHAPAVLDAVRSGRALAWTAMARAERAEIASRPRCAYLFADEPFRDPQRCAVMLAARDVWAPPRVAAELAPLVHPLPTPVGHSFVVHPAQRRIVVDALDAAIAGRGSPALAWSAPPA